jgi:hypothetical protein
MEDITKEFDIIFEEAKTLPWIRLIAFTTRGWSAIVIQLFLAEFFWKQLFFC